MTTNANLSLKKGFDLYKAGLRSKTTFKFLGLEFRFLRFYKEQILHGSQRSNYPDFFGRRLFKSIRVMFK